MVSRRPDHKQEELMEIFTLLIAIVALVIAIMAFQRTGGGMQDLRRQIEDLSEKSEHATKGARDRTADALSRLEAFIRGQQKASSTEQEPPENQPSTSTEQKISTPQPFTSSEQETTKQEFPPTDQKP